MRRALALAALAPATALAVLGIGEPEFTARLRDAAGGKPLDAFVIAREFATEGNFHGTNTYCLRADAASGSDATMRLPSAGIDTFTSDKAIDAFAYKPGYCIARFGDAAGASQSKRHSFGMPIPPSVDTSRGVDLALARSTQAPLERILYLVDALEGMVCQRWSDRGRENVQRMGAAMSAEARALATTPYERALAERIGYGVTVALEAPNMARDIDVRGLEQVSPVAVTLGFTRDFVIAPGDAAISFSDPSSGRPNIVALPSPAPQSTAVAVGPSGFSPPKQIAAAPVPVPAGLVVRCRHGAVSACDLNQRDSNGYTAMHQLVEVLRIDEVRALLDAGADPSVPGTPRGPLPIENLLQRIANTPPNMPQAAKASELLALLAGHPKAALHAALKEDFAADPSTWTQVKNQYGAPKLIAERERLAALPTYDDPKPGCEPSGFGRRELPPFRLRFLR